MWAVEAAAFSKAGHRWYMMCLYVREDQRFDYSRDACRVELTWEQADELGEHLK